MPVKSKNQNQKSQSSGPAKLYRSENNRVIAGVSGGLAEFFNVDPTLVRLIFVIITLFGGGGVLLYLVLWLIIPSQSNVTEITHDSIKQNADEIKNKAQEFAKDMKISTQKQNSKTLFGIIIIILGLIFLLGNFGLWDFFNLGRFWPLILVVVGFALLIRGERK